MATPERGSRIEQAGRQVRAGADGGADRLRSALDYELIPFEGLSLNVGGLLSATVVLAAAWFGSTLLRRALSRYGVKHANVNRASLYTISQVLHYVVVAVGVMLALELAGIPISRFTVFAGAIGVGLGFGLQAIFSNFISGLILLFDKSLKVGDFVELASGVHGEVRDINMRATTVVTNDNIDILVPNSEFVSGRVVNWTHRDVSRRIRIPFGVAYGTDKELVKKAALEAAAEVPFTLALEGARRPQVWLVEFGASSLNFELVTWLTAEATKRPSAVQAAYLWALDSALCKYGIEIPFPQQDLHIRSVFGHRDAAGLAAWRGEDPEAADARSAKSSKPDVLQEVDAGEHHKLASNDAQLDVEQEIAHDARTRSSDNLTTDPEPRG